MVDRSDFQNCRQGDGKLLVQFAAHSLFGCLTFFNTASGGPVEDKTGLRILNFRDQECVAMADQAQGSLSDFDFHVATESFYGVICLLCMVLEGSNQEDDAAEGALTQMRCLNRIRPAAPKPSSATSRSEPFFFLQPAESPGRLRAAYR